VEIERCGTGPFGPEQAHIRAARAFSPGSWRGGIAGLSAYDEVLCPAAMAAALDSRGATAALLVGPDWPLLDVSATTGCAAVVSRHLEHPDQHRIVFTQAPPGLGGCLLHADLCRELAQRSRLSTIGSLLVYQPHVPQGDPIARDANVQIDHRVRRSLVRATADSLRQQALLGRAFPGDPGEMTPAEIVEALERVELPESGPREVVLELTTDRAARGRFGELTGAARRPAMAPETARRLVTQIADLDECVLTLGGAGDPLLHDAFDELVAFAVRLGVLVHVRTELRAEPATIDRLLATAPHVISVDVNAHAPATYERMMGRDDHGAVLERVQRLVDGRTHLAGPADLSALARPWIVPRLLRCRETYEDIDAFFDHWQRALGTAVIDAPPPGSDDLAPAVTPARVRQARDARCLTVLADGRAPVDGDDLNTRGETISATTGSLADAWREILDARRARWAAAAQETVAP
jgi:hypothetical protein